MYYIRWPQISPESEQHFELMPIVSESCRGVLTTLQALGIDARKKDLHAIRAWFRDQSPDRHMERVLEIANPYLGSVGGTYTDWTPLDDRGQLFPEDVDTADPWQFKNIRVV